MALARQVAYEVYYLQYGRWQIHHRYDSSERDEAVEEAKRLDTQGHFEASCVVRESTDPGSGTASESVVYHSPKLKAKPPVSFITSGQDGVAPTSKASAPPGSAKANAAGGGGGRSATKRDKKAAKDAFGQLNRGKGPPSKKKAPPKKAKKKAGGGAGDWSDAIPGLLIAFILACAVGTGFGVGAFYGIKAMAEQGFNPGRQLNQVLLIAAWAGGWAITFFPLMRRAMDQVAGPGGTSKGAASKAPLAKAAPPKARATAPTPRNQAATAAKPVGASKSTDTQALPDTPSPESETAPSSEDARPDSTTDVEMADLEAVRSEGVETAGAPEGPPVLEQLATYLSALVEEAKKITAGAVTGDQFLRFGVILFIAGAAETFARFLKVPDRDAIGVLSGQIQAMGAPESLAKGFAANIDEYLLDQKYFDMYATGRGGALRLTKDTAAASGLPEAIEEWRKPKAVEEANPEAGDSKHYDGAPGEQEAHGFVAVLFTDIVNSTENLNNHGDQWLIQVVRAHNEIVREAIGTHGGREIKHTGDGIMASFPTVAPSVAAGLAMQDGIKRFSEMMPDLGFELCVGISAGEPIHESGDLFGTPVNLAARVLSKAGPGQTAVSTVVREMCQGRSFEFDELGRFELKGFNEPQPIYLARDRRKAARGSDSSGRMAATG